MSALLLPEAPGIQGINWGVMATRVIRPGDIDEFRARFGKIEGEARFFRDVKPTDRIEVPGNLLVLAGASILLRQLRGDGLTAFSNANSYIGVGDSTTAAADTQTDLQAASNKVRVAMDSTYPTHTNGTAVMRWQMTAGSAVANFAWQEWAIFNASTAGTMLNRKVASLGTKSSGSSWTFYVDITLS